MKRNIKKLLLPVLGLAVLLGGAYFVYQRYSPPAPAVNEGSETDGETAPDFTVFDADGNEIDFARFKGKPTVINFWASWCPPCCAELPYFDSAFGEYGGEVNFVMVNLTDGSRETKSSVDGFIESSGYSFPVYYDLGSDAADAYCVSSIPLSVFISGDGKIKNTHLGMMSESDLINELKALTGR